MNERRVELLGKGGRVRKIEVLHGDVLQELAISRRFVYLEIESGHIWKDGFERYVRHGCDALGIHRRGVMAFVRQRLASSSISNVRRDVLEPRPGES